MGRGVWGLTEVPVARVGLGGERELIETASLVPETRPSHQHGNLSTSGSTVRVL